MIRFITGYMMSHPRRRQLLHQNNMEDLSIYTDAQILAATAWGENRGGGGVGMQSVLNVIMNRADHPTWWGDDPRDCCLKPEQFDCWDSDDPNYTKLIALLDGTSQDNNFDNATAMAIQAISGTLTDITNGATYYYAVSMPQKPYWAKGHTPCAVIANQAFFNDIN